MMPPWVIRRPSNLEEIIMRGHSVFFLLLGLPGLVACTDGDKGVDTGGSVAFAPMEGMWHVTSEEVIVDTCGMTDSEGDTGEASEPDLTLMLSDQGDGSWTLVPDDWEEGEFFSCTLNNRALTCDPVAQSIDMAAKGIAAVVNMSQSVDIDFVTEEDGNFVRNLEAECVGDGCSQLVEILGIEFPCSVNMSGEVAHTGM
jgi:hypothetical protein